MLFNYKFDLHYIIWVLPLNLGLSLGRAISYRNGKDVDFGLKSDLEAEAEAMVEIQSEIDERIFKKEQKKNKYKLCLQLY